MRVRILNFLKSHPQILDFIWKMGRVFLSFLSCFMIKKKRIVFASFGGRNFDDSPKALYDAILKDKRFDNWELIWTFVHPENYYIPRGNKIKIDSLKFFLTLITSKIWISNSGMDRDIEIQTKGIIKIETWHGTPLKKIGGEENTGSMVIKRNKKLRRNDTIRCAQSNYDLEIFARIFSTPKEQFIISDLPRNDILIKGISTDELNRIRKTIGIPNGKKVLLYMPTYREYLMDEKYNYYLKPPIDIQKWETRLGDEFVLLIRAHYAVTKSIDIHNEGFAYDVSTYSSLNDLYFIADGLISDYSSAFFDFSLLEKPMFCFAYDYDEYSKKRGLYLDIEKTLPCEVDKSEDELLDSILSKENWSTERVKLFKNTFAPNAGNACNTVLDTIYKKLYD